MKRKVIMFALSIVFPSLSQAQASSQIDVSANVDPGCFISADNINFGVLNSPITNQSAQSNMRIHCSKNAIAKIDIQYGGEYGGTGTGVYTGVVTQTSTFSSNTYNQDVKIYLNNNPISNGTFDFHCSIHSPRQIYIITEPAKVMYGSNKLLWQNDSKGLCDASGKMNMTTLSNWVGLSDYGILSGMVSGEKIKYSLELPNDSTKVWSKGFNDYSIVATGVEEVITMKANIKSLNNPTYRMTPDIYTDTLTATITY